METQQRTERETVLTEQYICHLLAMAVSRYFLVTMATSSFIIRPAKSGDIPGIIQLLIEIRSFHHALRPDLFEGGNTTKYDAVDLEELLKRPDCYLYVATIQGQVVGHLIAFIHESETHRCGGTFKYLYVDDVCVAKKWQRHGIGRALMAQAEKVAKKSMANSIRLNVYHGNPAEDFYAELGYSPLSTMLEKMI